MNINIRICYSRTTPESVDDGDFSETGIEEEFAVTDDDLYGDTIVEYLARYAYSNGYCQASSCPSWSVGTCYETGYYTIDYSTGEEEQRTMHIDGLSEAESIDLYNRIKK